MDEATNKTIKQHEIQTDEWRFSELSKHLYIWVDRFNENFFDNILQTPAISFERRRANNLGHYVLKRNAFGFKWNININSRHVERPFAETLGTLLHEMIHQWQQEFGAKKIIWPRNNYHNVEFRVKSALLGIPSDNYGRTLGYEKPFLSLLEKYGLNYEPKPVLEEKVIGNSKLKKWTCGCTNARVAIVDFRAECLKCGNRFRLCG
jgi:hypothetical protein